MWFELCHRRMWVRCYMEIHVTWKCCYTRPFADVQLNFSLKKRTPYGLKHKLTINRILICVVWSIIFLCALDFYWLHQLLYYCDHSTEFHFKPTITNPCNFFSLEHSTKPFFIKIQYVHIFIRFLFYTSINFKRKRRAMWAESHSKAGKSEKTERQT